MHNHDDGTTDADRGLSIWLDGAPVLSGYYDPNARNVSSSFDKTATCTIPRIDLLAALYTTDFGDGPITDQHSFATDLIADVLVWAALKTDVEREWSLDSLVDSALMHARTEIAEAKKGQ